MGLTGKTLSFHLINDFNQMNLIAVITSDKTRNLTNVWIYSPYFQYTEH